MVDATLDLLMEGGEGLAGRENAADVGLGFP